MLPSPRWMSREPHERFDASLQDLRPSSAAYLFGKSIDRCPQVRRLAQYYAEDKNGSSLEADWKKAQPSPHDGASVVAFGGNSMRQESKQALHMLVNMGFDEVLSSRKGGNGDVQEKREEVLAMVITELISRKLVSCDFLKDGWAAWGLAPCGRRQWGQRSPNWKNGRSMHRSRAASKQDSIPD